MIKEMTIPSGTRWNGGGIHQARQDEMTATECDDEKLSIVDPSAIVPWTFSMTIGQQYAPDKSRVTILRVLQLEVRAARISLAWLESNEWRVGRL